MFKRPQKGWLYIKFHVKETLYTNSNMPLSVLPFQVRQHLETPNVYL